MTAMSILKMNRLLLRNDLAELQRLAKWVEDWLQNDVSPDLSLAIQLCLEEAVANVIMYGDAKANQREIAVELDRNGGTLVARIEDDGQQFDPTQIPPPSVARSLEAAKVGGLGIHLMRSFATGMHYDCRNGRNRLTLRFVESQARSQQPG